MALATGATLGPYEILGPAGAGGMGEVYRARDTRLDRTVAIKILPETLSASTPARQRFEREARAISSLSHPHICQLYDVGNREGIEFLVLEYLEGETLENRLKRGRLSIEQVLRYGAEVADALEKAHAKGLIHRDLKPGNIMLTKSGAKLLDFGLAKPIRSGISSVLTAITQERPLTTEGTIVGTYHYMAPEQVEGREADARSDIFSLGAVLYEMATGKRAFDGRTQATVIAAVLEHTPEPITTIQPMSPPLLDQVVKTCLYKDPDERFQTAHDLKLQLQWIAGGLIGTTASGTNMPAQPAARGLWRYLWAGAVILLLGTALVAWLLGRHSLPTRTEAVMRFEIAAPPGTQFQVGEDGGMELSPDGRELLFTADAGGKSAIWLRPVDSLAARQLPETQGAQYPFWSPDGRAIGFFVGNKLRRMPISGGDPETIATVNQPRGGAWSTKGVIVFGSRNDVIYKVADTGGTPEKLTKFDNSRFENTHRWPYMLPDGEHFLFQCGVGANASVLNRICAAGINEPQVKVLLEASSNVKYADGYLFYFHEGALHAHPFDAAKMQLTGPPVHIVERIHFDRGSGRALFSVANTLLVYQPGTNSEVEPIMLYERAKQESHELGPIAGMHELRFSPDGQRIAGCVTNDDSKDDVWTYDLAHGTKTRLTFPPSDNGRPVWSPDGSSIAFSSSDEGPTALDLVVKSLHGSSGIDRILRSDRDKYLYDWSSDGKYLVYAVQGEGGIIHALPLQGDRRPVDVVQSAYFSGSAVVSPDSKWLAYSGVEQGSAEIFVTKFPSGQGKWQVTFSGGGTPHWRRDGRELYYIALDGTIMAVAVTPMGDGIEFGPPQKLFSTHAIQDFLSYDASPDGKLFAVVNRAPADPTPLAVVSGWRQVIATMGPDKD